MGADCEERAARSFFASDTYFENNQFNNEVQHLGKRKGYPKCLWRKNMTT